ncbi:hypothetical protein Tco_1581062, partial [Tanacetum coccineum]
TTQPPILPSLSEFCTPQVMQNIKENVRSSRGSENKQGITELFYFFIEKFKNIRRKAKASYISIKQGQWVARKYEMLKEPLKPLWIEEPFGEELENLAKSIQEDVQLQRIQSVFKKTYKAILRGRMADIVKNLVIEDLVEVLNESKRDTIAMPSVVGQKSDMDDANGKSRYHVLGLDCYLSDDDEDKEMSR